MSANTQTSVRSTSNVVVEGQPQQLQSIDITKSTKSVKKQGKQKTIKKSTMSVKSATETSAISEKSLITTEATTVTVSSIENQIMSTDLEKIEIQSNSMPKSINKKTDSNEPSAENAAPKIKSGKKNSSSSTSSITNGARQSRKVKKSNLEKENISVKSSFSKFDELQKRNLIHDTQSDKKQNCHVCKKEVYKMEEINAEKNVYHKLCFRCNECEKQLKVDNYQSHEGVLYCKAHFKLLFMPKFVEKTDQDIPRKPELIIRENQPVELPPDVIRASDKPDLGLEELQQINIRSKFEAFEKSTTQQTETRNLERTPSITGVKRSASILSKLSKFQEKVGNNNNCPEEDSEDESIRDGESTDTDENDVDLVRAKRSQRERPVRLDNMNDIKSKFESGHIISKEERREERKHEIQNIRSRLFLGKQARIKEMYQQAVAESEHGIISVGKKPDIDIGDKARYLKEKFENGEIFKEHDEALKVPDDELEVFQSAISKKSRSLFQELDASSAAKNELNPKKQLPLLNDNSRVRSFDFDSNSIVKHDEKIDDIQVETSDIVSKFKFFETYKPVENEKKTFRITPPRDGAAVTLEESDEEQETTTTTTTQDIEPIEKSHTATIMLNKFRELEQIKNSNMVELGPRPLKCFTPPPDDGRRIYASYENLSNEEDEEEEYEGEEEGDYEDEDEDDEDLYTTSRHHLQDEALIQAQAAARAKQLRAKFEKWEAKEIKRETQDGTINLYEDNSEENHIESAKAIRAKFENMKENQSTQVVRPRYKVNRFV